MRDTSVQPDRVLREQRNMRARAGRAFPPPGGRAGSVPLRRVRAGDIIEVQDGVPELAYLALVEGREGRRLRVRPLSGLHSPPLVKSAWIAQLWRHV